ncbi:hypothetical protein STCU_07921 [Strigomonas culicis]|uniref:Nodulin-like domain-containing protein n=1 Tax=Strigomonas culicis TaxID=28005 RepID=S9TX20_9TRYP|nr:hypothetical protein STCU_07921 [Strigomonas culicis]|eukprot:EPY23037.1 hypothetical protein STCU_07921 [Strigomonas culicis]
MALSFAQIIHANTVRLCVFNGILGSGTMLFDLAAIVTVCSHFPTMRGATIALLKSFTGLGTAIFGSIRSGFLTRPDHFFYFLAAYSGAVGTVLLLFLRLPPYHLTDWEKRRLPMEKKQLLIERRTQYLRQKPPTWRFIVGYVILITLIIYLPVQSAVVTYMKLGSGPKRVFAVITAVLTASMILICAPDPRKFFASKKNAQNNDGQVDQVDLDAEEKTEPAGAPVETEVDYIAPQYQESFLHNLLTLRLWCLTWTLFCLTGIEYTIVLNASYIVGAIEGHAVSKDLRTLLSVLNGVGSAVGRLMMAGFEHWSQHRAPEKRIPFTWAALFPTILLVISVVLFLTLPGSVLPLPFVIVAIANGSQATLTVLIPRTIYGKDTAKHYNFCFVPSILSSILIVRFLYAEWYSVQAIKTGGTKGYCFGMQCVLMPLLVMLGLLGTSILSTVYLALSYSRFCARVLAERRRIREQGENAIVENKEESEEVKQLNVASMDVEIVELSDHEPHAQDRRV